MAEITGGGVTIDTGTEADLSGDGVETLREDGNAIDITLTQDNVEKGDVILEDGFFGIAMEDGDSGDDIAIEIAQRVHEIKVEGLTADKGDIIYIDSSGDLTDTEGDNKPFGKVVQAKDTNDYAWLLLLPQMTTQA